jgi:protein-disulfide isomerase
MRSEACLSLTAVLVLAAPQIAASRASQLCCQVNPPAAAQPAQPVSTVRDSDKAPITILVFSDFESFPCARSASVIDGLLQQTRDVRVIFKHAPAASNPNALLAHEAALAAGAQGKFWEMHDTLFENQTHLTRADLLGYAKSLGLDLAAFERALDNHTYRPIVERDLAEAAGLGVTTTPTFFVNGRRLVGPQGYASLGAVIESLLAGIPPDKRVREEIVAAGPAQQIDLTHAPTRGPATAPISLVEFSDFECPFCAVTAPVVRQLLLAYPAQIRFVFKHSAHPTGGRVRHPCLLLDQLHATVPGAAIVGVVGTDGRERADALRGKARGDDAVLRGQRRDHRVGAAFREVHVRGEGANVVGVADYEELQFGRLLEQFRNLLERGVGLGLDVGLGRIEVDPVDG